MRVVGAGSTAARARQTPTGRLNRQPDPTVTAGPYGSVIAGSDQAADQRNDGVRDDVREHVVERLGGREGVLILDDTGSIMFDVALVRVAWAWQA